MHYYNTCIFTNSVLIRKWFVDKNKKYLMKCPGESYSRYASLVTKENSKIFYSIPYVCL